MQVNINEGNEANDRSRENLKTKATVASSQQVASMIQSTNCWLLVMTIAISVTITQSIFRAKDLPSPQDRFTYMVSVSAYFFDTITKRSFFNYCGGTIIDERWIVTAASCVRLNDDMAHEIFIEYGFGRGRAFKLGKIYSNQTEAFIFWGFSWRDLEDARNHKDSPLEDIAMIKVPDELSIDVSDKNIARVIGLPPEPGFETQFDKQACYILGWNKRNELTLGEVKLHAPRHEVIKDTKVDPVVKRCSSSAVEGAIRPLSTPEICASEPDSGSQNRPCPSDRGGPLVCKDSSSHEYLIGVIPYIEGPCRRSAKNFSYIPVSQYLSWMAEVAHVREAEIQAISRFSIVGEFFPEQKGRSLQQQPGWLDRISNRDAYESARRLSIYTDADGQDRTETNPSKGNVTSSTESNSNTSSSFTSTEKGMKNPVGTSTTESSQSFTVALDGVAD